MASRLNAGPHDPHDPHEHDGAPLTTAQLSRRDVQALSPLEGEPDPDGADCVACGRCCHHGPSTVHLLEADEARMREETLTRLTVLVERPPGWRFVKNTGTCCAALDRSVPGQYPCSIYEERPEDCRIVEPGSPACLAARKLGRLGSSVEFRRVR